MAGFSHINVQGDNNQLMIPEGTRWENINISPPMTMFPMISQEEGSSSRKRRRKSNRRDDFLARLHLLAPRIPKRPPPSPVVPFRILNPTTTQFLFKKQLHRSDVGSVTRILLPKYEVEEHLPYLVFKEGIWMHMDDLDYYKVWTIKFRFWNNINSGRIYIFENTKEFLTSHGLGVGDSIEVFKDIMSGSFIIRASNTSGDPGVIDEQCLRRSRENDKHMFLNQVSGCNNKEQPQSAKNKYEQVGQGSSDVPNNLLPMENNADVVLNQDQADEIISTDEEVLQPAQQAESAQPASPAQDCGGQQEENTIDNVLNESFPTLDDFDYLYALLEW
ncbi:hypothetical protein ACLB2K_039679 [Fragaria x ananassa]